MAPGIASIHFCEITLFCLYFGFLLLWLKTLLKPWPIRLRWLDCRPANQKVTGLIPGQGAYEKATNGCFSLTPMFLSLRLCLCLSLPPSLSSSLSKRKKKCPWGRIKQNKSFPQEPFSLQPPVHYTVNLQHSGLPQGLLL